MLPEVQQRQRQLLQQLARLTAGSMQAAAAVRVSSLSRTTVHRMTTPLQMVKRKMSKNFTSNQKMKTSMEQAMKISRSGELQRISNSSGSHSSSHCSGSLGSSPT
jgi:curli biogenesis system outer membrane secretion channel CsgG